jgi:HK97 family phage major capsid protein
MLTKDINAKKLAAIEAARSIARDPAYTGTGESEIAYKRATADARRFAALESEQREIDALDAETGTARSALSSVIFPASGGRTMTAVDPLLRDFLTPGSPVTDYWVRPTREQVMGPASKFATRSAYLTTDTATTGAAYFFTPELYQKVVTGIIDSSGVLEAEPTMIVTDHLRQIQVPVLTQDAVATAGVEGSPATATNTEGDAVTLGAHRYDGKFAVSIETIMASEYDLTSLLSTFAIRAIASKTAEMLALGNGTTQPQGLFTAAGVTVGKTAASKTVVTSTECIQFMKALPKGYRKAARIVASDALHTYMLSWLDAEGQYLLRSIEGGGDQFMGKPMFTEPQADQSGMSASEVHAVAGDFSGYYVRLSPMFFRRSDADPLNPVFTFAIWLDAKIADAQSLVSLAMSA